MAINSLNTVTRLMGLSSGMDTESIIQNLMQIEQLKLNKQLRAQTTLQWRQDALKSVNTDMTTFRNTFLTALGTDGMRTSGTYISYNVSMQGTKQDAVTVKAGADAAVKKVTINKIAQLAEGASAKGSSGVSAAGQTELSEGNYVKLGDLNFANDLFAGTKTVQVARQVQVEDETYGLKFTDKQGNLVFKNSNGEFTDFEGTILDEQPIESELNPVMTTARQDKTNADGHVMYSDNNGQVYYKDGDTFYKMVKNDEGVEERVDMPAGDEDFDPDALTKVTEVIYDDKVVADDTIQFAINGVEFTFTKDTTLAQMFSAVNNSTAGVSMTYSRLTDSFSITSKETGGNSQLVIENIRGNAFGTGGTYTDENGDEQTMGGSAFGINTAGTSAKDADGKITLDGGLQGKNAVIYIEGVRVERSSNVFSIDGISYTLNYTTGEDNATINEADNITATFTQDVQSSMDKIKKFVEGYNTMVNKLYSLVTEPKSSKYYALTDDEKAAMTEDQVKEWEAIAKSGLLRNDRDIQDVLGRLREAFYTTVEGTGLSAQDIGLRTAYGSRSGEITINESDLRAALERDADGVMRVFMQTSQTDNYSEQGLTFRLEEIIKNYTGTTQFNTLSNLDRDMGKLVTKISEMEDRMATLEERYYLKYAAMETALAKMQSQTNWISSMLG